MPYEYVKWRDNSAIFPNTPNVLPQPTPQPVRTGSRVVTMRCRVCKGKGEFRESECATCHGSGIVQVLETWVESTPWVHPYAVTYAGS